MEAYAKKSMGSPSLELILLSKILEKNEVSRVARCDSSLHDRLLPGIHLE